MTIPVNKGTIEVLRRQDVKISGHNIILNLTAGVYRWYTSSPRKDGETFTTFNIWKIK